MTKLQLAVGIMVILAAQQAQAQWEPDVRLTVDPAFSNTSIITRCIASAGDTVHIVWRDNRDGNSEIYYKTSRNKGHDWSEDTSLTSDPGVSSNPTIAAQGANVHLVWMEDRDGNDEIYYKHSADAGTTWGPDFRLTTNAAYQWYPSISVSGMLVSVIWYDFRDGTWEIYYKHSTDGGLSWGSDTPLTSNSLDSYNPVVVSSGMAVHVAWYDNRDDNDEIYYKRSVDGGISWGPDTRLTSADGYSYDPSIAVSGSVVHIAWFDSRDDGSFEIYYKRSEDGGLSWGPDMRLTTDINVSWYPSLTAVGPGVHVVWTDSRDGNMEIYYKNSKDGGVTWGSDTRLTDNLATSDLPSVSFSGAFVHVAWEDDRDGNWEIYYKRDSLDLVTGTENMPVQDLSRQLTIYPNPAQKHFTVVLPQQSFDLVISDITGKVVQRANNLFDRAEIVFTDLIPGIYFVRTTTNDRQSFCRKITILRH